MLSLLARHAIKSHVGILDIRNALELHVPHTAVRKIQRTNPRKTSYDTTLKLMSLYNRSCVEGKAQSISIVSEGEYWTMFDGEWKDEV